MVLSHEFNEHPRWNGFLNQEVLGITFFIQDFIAQTLSNAYDLSGLTFQGYSLKT